MIVTILAIVGFTLLGFAIGFYVGAWRTISIFTKSGILNPDSVNKLRSFKED